MSLTRIGPRVGDWHIWRRLRRISLAAASECQREGKSAQGDSGGEVDRGRPARSAGRMPAAPGDAAAERWPPHPKNLFLAAATAARTRSGAVPPKLVRLATERPASSTS